MKIAAKLTLALCLVTIGSAPQLRAQAPAAAQKDTTPGLLTRDQAAAILPPSVFYRGQSASIQGRNSSGIRLDGGALILATLVDTSGYSSSVQEKYQAYLITEVPLTIGDRRLPPGAYGFGFVAGDKMVVLDVGAHELLQAATHRDADLKRPTPLQILPVDSSPNHFRLYLGRSFVTLAPAS